MQPKKKKLTTKLLTERLLTKKLPTYLTDNLLNTTHMNTSMDNLFVYGTATYGDCFMDREQETTQLKQNFLHGIKTMLISPRRWGKTSLVHHVGDVVFRKMVGIVLGKSVVLQVIFKITNHGM